MALTAQNIVDSVSQDIRALLAASGTDAAILLDYVNRIHIDVLHSSIFSYLNQGVTTINTVVGTTNYTMSPTDIRSILTVYDRTRQRLLLPLADAVAPAALQGEDSKEPVPSPRDQLRLKFLSSQAEFYRRISTTTLYLFPTPQQVQTIEVHYDKLVPAVAALGTTLTTPDDSKDTLVAGVNYLACLFLKKTDEAKSWYEIYTQLKSGKTRSE